MITDGKIALGKPNAHGQYQVSRTWCAYLTMQTRRITGFLQDDILRVPWSKLDLQREQLRDAVLLGDLLAIAGPVNEFTVTLVKNTKAHGRVVDKVRHFYRARDGRWRSV